MFLSIYEVSGAGSPVVLIHEGIGDSRMFAPQMAALSARHQVVRYDLHGYGRSGKPQTPYTNHEALDALLQHLGIKKTAILGMSMGGNIALDYALTYPEKVSGLILIGAGLDGVPSDPETLAFIQPMIDAYEAEDGLARDRGDAACLDRRPKSHRRRGRSCRSRPDAHLDHDHA